MTGSEKQNKMDNPNPSLPDDLDLPSEDAVPAVAPEEFPDLKEEEGDAPPAEDA